jgi:hypothetical protein
MCDQQCSGEHVSPAGKSVPVAEAVGMMLAHDITEIRKDEFKGAAFRKGHIISAEDISHLKRLGKEHLYVLSLAEDEMHEDDAARALVTALAGNGVGFEGEPREGKITLVAARDGLLRVNRDALRELNMLGDVMCATRHSNSIVRQGNAVAATRAIPLAVKRAVVSEAVRICNDARGRGGAVLEVREIRRPTAGVVITGNEIYHGRIKDAFAPVITRKIEALGGRIAGIYYAPDDTAIIEQRLRELLDAGADLLITTGGMSVDPDDVTRFAIRALGARDIVYGSPVLPGAMFLIAYADVNSGSVSGVRREREGLAADSSDPVPILGVPACGMYHAITILDLVLPRVLAGEIIGRQELADMGYGGFCLQCKECRYPVCPFGK